jgi:hypothetical protein
LGTVGVYYSLGIFLFKKKIEREEEKINMTEEADQNSSQTSQPSHSKRIVNFSAGPGILPKAVLAKAQTELLNFKNTQCSLMVAYPSSSS